MLVEGGARCSMGGCISAEPRRPRTLEQDRDAGRQVRVADAEQKPDRIRHQEAPARREGGVDAGVSGGEAAKPVARAARVVPVVVAAVLNHQAALAKDADL